MGKGTSGQILFRLDVEGEVLMGSQTFDGLSKTVGYDQHFSVKNADLRQHHSIKLVL